MTVAEVLVVGPVVVIFAARWKQLSCADLGFKRRNPRLEFKSGLNPGLIKVVALVGT